MRFLTILFALSLLGCNSISSNEVVSCQYEKLDSSCGQLQLNVSTTRYNLAYKEVNAYLASNNGKEIRSNAALAVLVVYFPDAHSELQLIRHMNNLKSFRSVNRAHFVMTVAFDMK